MTYKLPEIPGFTWGIYGTEFWLLVRNGTRIPTVNDFGDWLVWVKFEFPEHRRDAPRPEGIVNVGFRPQVTGTRDQHFLGRMLLKDVTAELLLPYLSRARVMGWI